MELPSAAGGRVKRDPSGRDLSTAGPPAVDRPGHLTASNESAEAIGAAASVEVLAGAGHFPWHERPGALLASLDRLVATT